MKKLKICTTLFLLSFLFLVGCGKSISENNLCDESVVSSNESNLEENNEFDKVFEDFTTLTENIREEKEVISNSNYLSSSKEDITVLNLEDYTDEELGLVIDFIDVGQGDSILLKSNNEYMLIDAGDTNYENKVYDYVSNKTSSLEYFVETHPHKDHIGGLPKTLSNLEVKNVIMPKGSFNETSYYKEMISIIEEKEINVIEPIVGESFELGDATVMILAPNNNEYEDVNNYSIVLKVSYKDTSFLLCGDAENLSENEIMDTGFDISADVIKLGHHGSKYSSSSKFLNTVNPSVAVISVGEGNQYKHPHDDTLSKLDSRGILTYRTDINGTICIGTDGTNIYAITEKLGEESSLSDNIENEIDVEIDNDDNVIYPEDDETYIVYTTRDGKYHNENCSELSKVYNTVTLGVAKEMNYKPCTECDAPK